jgi:hypothetical protein
MTELDDLPPASRARRLAKAGRPREAADIVATLLQEAFGLDVANVRIGVDAYSLNSLNGTFEAGGQPLFFKFHEEENEAAMAGEYYRVQLLAEAGFPIDVPLYLSSVPGRQILVYRRRNDRRFADVLRDLDLAPNAKAAAGAVAAEDELNRQLMSIYARDLHPISAAQSAAEPIHRLFHERLIDAGDPTRPGGRLAAFYIDKVFDLPGLSLTWFELSRLRVCLNGVTYRQTLGELFEEALVRLRPGRLDGGGVRAHGDAHNANVWYEIREGQLPRLSLFDPAFAGSHVPALLAEVKTTFHNVFAHPLWLYEPEQAVQRFRIDVQRDGGQLAVHTDWSLGPVREALLASKRDLIWRPLIRLLDERSLLPSDWRRVVRLGLFLCPTLVMSLRAADGRHNPQTSALGFAIAVMMGSEPADGRDIVTGLLDAIAPG